MCVTVTTQELGDLLLPTLGHTKQTKGWAEVNPQLVCRSFAQSLSNDIDQRPLGYNCPIDVEADYCTNVWQ